MATQLLKQTTRERELDRARRYYWGRQYDDLKDWSDDSVATRERKPTVRLRLTKQAVDTVNSYLFGERRSPTFNVPDDPAATEVIQNLFRTSGLSRKLGEVGRLGNLQGEVAVAFHKLDDAFDVEFLTVDLARVTLGRHDKLRAQQLGVSFDDVLDLDEFWREFIYDYTGAVISEVLHRRTWTTDQTIEYLPIDLRTTPALVAALGSPDEVLGLQDLPWQVDEERTVTHDFGFVPVEWIPNGEIANDVEGHPLLTDAEFDLEDEINYVLSQAGRGIQYNGEPLTVFLNVAGTRNRNPNGQQTELERGAGNTLALRPQSDQQPADAKTLELSGSGQMVAMEFARDLRAALFEVLQIVRHDPQLFAGTLSGVALERILGPTISHVSRLRPYYGKGLARLLSKMAWSLGELERGTLASPTWPDVVEKTTDDIMMDISVAGDAMDRGLIRREEAIQRIAPYFGVEDPEKYAMDMAREEAQNGTFRQRTAEPPNPVGDVPESDD